MLHPAMRETFTITLMKLFPSAKCKAAFPLLLNHNLEVEKTTGVS